MATMKQIRAVKRLVENGGNVSRAMIDAGYSPQTAKTPQKLTESKVFNDLLEEYLPDDKLLKTHKKALEATTLKPHLVDRDDKGRPVYDYVKEEDIPTQLRAVELGYKVKRKLGDLNGSVQINNIIGLKKNEYSI